MIYIFKYEKLPTLQTNILHSTRYGRWSRWRSSSCLCGGSRPPNKGSHPARVNSYGLRGGERRGLRQRLRSGASATLGRFDKPHHGSTERRSTLLALRLLLPGQPRRSHEPSGDHYSCDDGADHARTQLVATGSEVIATRVAARDPVLRWLVREGGRR